VLILRIRQAETALADGRLDEAYDLAQADDLRSHRKGQDLISRLVVALVNRGRDHLDAGRHQQAFADAQKAFRLGGNRPEVSQLQTAVVAALMARRQWQQQKADAVATARQQLHNGELTMAENVLADANVDGQAAGLLREAAARRAAAEPAIQRAKDALDRQDWDVAIQSVLDARQFHAANPQVTQMATQVTQQVMREIREMIDQGRVDRAYALIQRLTPLAGQTVDVQEAARIVEQCRLAADCVRRGQPRGAEQALRQLASIQPSARWLKGAIEAARQAAEGLEHLQTGPLGLVAPMPAGSPERYLPVERDEITKQVTVKLDRPSPVSDDMGLPERFMLHVDGVGSYLVVRGRQVTVGRAGSTDQPDVPLMAEAGLPAVTIERVEEDYFLRSRETIFVNEQAVTRKLLADGDRIALSSRSRLKFSVPNAASTSAVLHLAGTRLPKTDARRVILLDRELIIGPGTASHVRADALADPVVLYVRDGQLCVRTKEAAMVGEQALAGSAGLPMDSSIKIGPVSFVVTKA